VQSGSDRVLALMTRGYTTLEFKEKVRKLRAARPDIAISSDFFVDSPARASATLPATLAHGALPCFDGRRCHLERRRRRAGRPLLED